MIRFLTLFLRNSKQLLSKTSKHSSGIAHTLHKSGLRSFGGRISSLFFKQNYIMKVLFLLLGSQVLIGILGLVTISGLFGIGKIIGFLGIKIPWYHSLVTSSITMFSWLWSVSCVWLLILSVNHWNDLCVLVVQADPGDLVAWLSLLCSYFWVGTFNMAWDFFSTLIHDPQNLLNTKAIWEIVLLKDTIGGFSLWAHNSLISVLPSVFTPVLVSIKSYIGLTYNTLTSFIGSSVTWVWTSLVSSIATTITPIVHPVIQPVVTQIGQGVASAIGVSIILWILRILFGFPF